MNSDRLDQLLNYYQEDSKDPFIIYGIAMEYWKFDLEKSRKYFEILLQNHPDYLATYYQVAHLYEELDEIELAKQLYRKGIEIAEIQNNQNTLRELKNALQELEFFE
ncbi:MAG: tetratricopeptide repeat protein [Fulvivirga sp.]|uniref:tetratricopeptide repeat protein n=1 Tax=Fulvivirga sp. TaxID=1931237 RepID=UPI0032ECAD51